MQNNERRAWPTVSQHDLGELSDAERSVKSSDDGDDDDDDDDNEVKTAGVLMRLDGVVAEAKAEDSIQG